MAEPVTEARVRVLIEVAFGNYDARLQAVLRRADEVQQGLDGIQSTASRSREERVG